ncbi:mCG146880 [Mus musculus]|nr:mCG146880 [Mus musculus]
MMRNTNIGKQQTPIIPAHQGLSRLLTNTDLTTNFKNDFCARKCRVS